jgi:hypothetical protein
MRLNFGSVPKWVRDHRADALGTLLAEETGRLAHVANPVFVYPLHLRPPRAVRALAMPHAEHVFRQYRGQVPHRSGRAKVLHGEDERLVRHMRELPIPRSAHQFSAQRAVELDRPISKFLVDPLSCVPRPLDRHLALRGIAGRGLDGETSIRSWTIMPSTRSSALAAYSTSS